MEKFLSEPSFWSAIIGAIITAVITIWTFGKVHDSAISYGLENLQQNSQHERFKAFHVTFRFFIHAILLIIAYNFFIYLFRELGRFTLDGIVFDDNTINDLKKFYIIIFLGLSIIGLLCLGREWYVQKKLSAYRKYIRQFLVYFVIYFDFTICIDYFALDRNIELIIIGAVLLVFTIKVYNISRYFYNKMANTAFLYFYYCNEKRYIYKKVGNQFLCSNKDYLQWDKKAFFTELKKVEKAIKQQRKKKKWITENKGDLDNKIKKLARYSGYIRIDEGDKCFEELKQYIDSDTATVVGIETILIKMIGEFQEMTAVELVHEDKLKNFKIYPIIDEYHNGFFWKV